jgi:LacI family transcriptional regulator, gluconate utilization system Gnt-I transcriptional repressor
MSSSTRTHRTSVKITDVAARAGVAPMTVSRVLNSPDRVAAATALRVREAIAELGYVPNLMAGGLSSRRSRLVAAIVPTITTPIFAACIGSFTDALERAGYHVVLGLSGYDPAREEELVAAILGRQPDGLLLTGATHSDTTLARIGKAGVPVVEIWDETPVPTDMLVGFDHAKVGAAVAEFFLREGHRDFAVIAADDVRARARHTGFVAAVRAAGGRVVAERAMPAPGAVLGGRAAMREIIPLIADRLALFCSSDLVAAGAVIEAQRAGVAVPQRLAVCGFGNFELGQAFEPAITTVSVDSAAIGRQAADALLRRFRGEDARTHSLVPFRIERRGSV